jgi:hypothetical protein
LAFKNTNVPKFPSVREQRRSCMIQPASENALSEGTEVASIEK